MWKDARDDVEEGIQRFKRRRLLDMLYPVPKLCENTQDKLRR